MAYVITRMGRPITDKTFESIDAAFDFARAPAWAGAKPTEIEVLTEASYKFRGDIYTIESRSTAPVARQTSAGPSATKAQVRYLVILRDRVPAPAWSAITGGVSPSAMTKAAASAAITRLSDIATH